VELYLWNCIYGFLRGTINLSLGEKRAGQRMILVLREKCIPVLE
jgi:hypothetical protein